MDAVTGQDQQALVAQLAQAREKLDGLVRDLRTIDGELDGLATERRQHHLLHDVCGALEELGEIGGAELFWGDRTAVRSSEDHIRRVRSRVDVFQKGVSEIEDRRQALVEQIEQQHDYTDLLEDDVLEAQEEEERRQQEWSIEREAGVLPSRELIMPWARGGEDDRRFRRLLAASVLYSLLFALVAPQIALPLNKLGEEIEVPERVVRLMMEARPLPPAPPREETRMQPQELAEQKPAEEAVPEAKPDAEGPGKGSGEGPDEGPAIGPGILAFREKFAGFKEAQVVARLGSNARISNSGDTASGRSERSMITTQAPGSSGGINLASLSRGVGGGGGNGSGGGAPIAGVQVARATSTIGGGDGSSRSGSGGGSRNGPPLGRTDEEIQIVFDRHKAALYRLYNRELRSDPTLKGQMVLRMRIEPDGSVSLCALQATDMNAPQLAAQVVDRVRTFDFGAKEGIAAMTILYPIDFLPAT